MENNELSVLNATKLELHYWFNDNSHTMDATIQNKCEYEFLGIINEIASNIGIEVIIETEPFGEGGLIRWFKIKTHLDKKSSTIKVAVVTALVTAVLVTPLNTVITKVTEKLIEHIFEDNEKAGRLSEKEKLELEDLKLDIQLKQQLLNKNTVITKKKSNFYDALNNYPKISQISIINQGQEEQNVNNEFFIEKEKFKEFILVNDDLEPIEIDGAIIEIISPVLKKGKYKWMGIYNGEIISFNMQSNEFKTNVQTGKIEFKNGSSINCLMSIRKRVDNEGLERIVGYDIVRVNSYFENDKPVETSEGKRHRQKLEMDKQQTKLF